jgi:hypothetical protein
MTRFTVYGDDGLEARIRTTLMAMAAEVAEACPKPASPVLILFGGYGRGEGGTERRGRETLPHNNFDLLLLTRGLGPRRRQGLQRRLSAVLRGIGSRLGVGVDLSVVPRRVLTRGRSTVMWHDLRGGHHTLLGDGSFLQRCTHLDHVPADDMHRLLVNRGTLLLINRSLGARGRDTAGERRLVLKHRAKAILGYGDALLHAAGLYHWSYLEKARRVDLLPGGDPAFAALHRDALEFRLAPDYTEPPTSLLDFDDEVVDRLLAPVHLAFLRRWSRIPTLTWREVPERLQTLLARERRRHPVEGLRGVAHTTLSGLGFGAGALRRSDRLALAYPALAYRTLPGSVPIPGILPGDGRDPLDTYLRTWGHHGDRNMAASLLVDATGSRPRASAHPRTTKMETAA